MPFRETHHISGAAVKMAEDKGCELSDLSVADLQSIHPLFADDVVEVGVVYPCTLSSSFLCLLRPRLAWGAAAMSPANHIISLLPRTCLGLQPRC